MEEITNVRFHEMINEAMASLPKTHTEMLKNVAILLEDNVSTEQRQRLNLADNQTLLGLYEGVPLSKRQGMAPTLPDRITLFKYPILNSISSESELKNQIRHTLWHEIAHYYGLDHPAISELE